MRGAPGASRGDLLILAESPRNGREMGVCSQTGDGVPSQRCPSRTGRCTYFPGLCRFCVGFPAAWVEPFRRAAVGIGFWTKIAGSFLWLKRCPSGRDSVPLPSAAARANSSGTLTPSPSATRFRVFTVGFALDGTGCLVCCGLLDVAEAQEDLLGPEGQREREALYGIERAALDRSGPSVVSINGVVASVAVTEFMVAATGLRVPQRVLTYYGQTGKVTVSRDEPAPDCYYCTAVRGRQEAADVQRYVRAGVGSFLR